MTNLQTVLQRACQELGLTIVVPFVLTVREGFQINAQALIPQLGAPKGMIIVRDFDDLLGISSELVDMGYGYSVLSGPSNPEPLDLETYTRIFDEWGWSSMSGPQPGWMT